MQYLQCPNGFDKYVVTDITVKLNSSAIKPILIKPKILMSGRSLCYPVWCLDDRNFSSLFGTITPTQALETWDKASWLKEKVPYKLWQIWHACWLVYDRETKAQFSDYPKMYFVITPGLAQCFSIFKKRLTNGKHVLTSISFSKVLKGRNRISWRTVLQRHDLSLTTAEISPSTQTLKKICYNAHFLCFSTTDVF